MDETEVHEDDGYVFIPEELFEHLPPEFRDAFEARRQEGTDILRVVDKDLQGLVRLANAMPTAASLGYIYHRLRAAEFDTTMEALLEQEMLTTSFVVTYARLFVSGKGGAGIDRSQVPLHLREVHDQIIEMRHERYAHNGGHDTLGTSLQIEFDDEAFRIGLQMSSSFHIGGRNEWKELVKFINEHMHERLFKIIAKLKLKTGKEWEFPSGPAPDWA